MRIVAARHIYVDSNGVAWIANTTTKVLEVVREYLDGSLSPEQIHSEHPHLMLAQIHAALSYYYDNKSEVDEEISRRRDVVELFRASATAQLTRSELETRIPTPPLSAPRPRSLRLTSWS
jgi:uncharacterized protein (DUF433 family)